MTEDVLFTQEGQIGVITLNRPKALNALNLPMILAWQQQLNLWKTNATIKAVVVRAAIGNAFCAGGDVRWLYQMKGNVEEQLSFFWHEYRLNQSINALGKPYIALMDGITMGGGVGIALHGSHPVASERFIFAMPETSIGLFPDIGASYLLSRCPGALGIYLGLTGERLDAGGALGAGLVKHVITAENMPGLIDALNNLDLSADAHAQVSQLLSKYEVTGESDVDAALANSINEAFSQASVALILASLAEHADPKMQHIAAILKQKSPLSLVICLEQLQRAKGLSLAECLTMDFTLVSHFMTDHDFYEGIRALLFDKDKKPQWNPARLDLVTSEKVMSYFETNKVLDFN